MASRRGASRFTRPTRDLRVLVDMDGVIADFESHLEKVIRENHPDIPCIALQDRTTFYAADQYYQIGGDELKVCTINSIRKLYPEMNISSSIVPKSWPIFANIFFFISSKQIHYIYLTSLLFFCLQKKVSDIINSPGFYRNIPPMENAIDAVKELSGMDGWVQLLFYTGFTI